MIERYGMLRKLPYFFYRFTLFRSFPPCFSMGDWCVGLFCKSGFRWYSYAGGMCNPQLYPSVSFETRAGFALTICVHNVLARFARTIRVRNLRACFEARVSKRMRARACAYACVWQTPCAFLLVQPDDCCRS